MISTTRSSLFFKPAISTNSTEPGTRRVAVDSGLCTTPRFTRNNERRSAKAREPRDPTGARFSGGACLRFSLDNKNHYELSERVAGSEHGPMLVDIFMSV